MPCRKGVIHHFFGDAKDSRTYSLFVRGCEVAIINVFRDGANEKRRISRHDSDGSSEAGERDFLDTLAVYCN